MAAIQLIDVAAIPDKFQRVLPTLAVGRFFEWCREAEISADRAGLLCCASPEVAYSALMRLLHGLKADSIWINPGKDFDAAALVAQFERWENKPFVKFLVHIKHCPQEAPFIPERIAALKYWAEKGPYRQILAHRGTIEDRQMVVIKSISVTGVAAEDSPADIFIRAYDQAYNKLFRLQTAKKVTEAAWEPIDVAHRCLDCQPVFFEAWQAGTFKNWLLGGFVIYPEKGRSSYSVPIIWSWNERSDTARAGTATVEVTFELKAKEE